MTDSLVRLDPTPVNNVIRQFLDFIQDASTRIKWISGPTLGVLLRKTQRQGSYDGWDPRNKDWEPALDIADISVQPDNLGLIALTEFIDFVEAHSPFRQIYIKDVATADQAQLLFVERGYRRVSWMIPSSDPQQENTCSMVKFLYDR